MRAVAEAPWALGCEGKGGRSSAPRVYVHIMGGDLTVFLRLPIAIGEKQPEKNNLVFWGLN